MKIGDRVAYAMAHVLEVNHDQVDRYLKRRGTVVGFHPSKLFSGETAASVDWDDGLNTSITTRLLVLADQVHLGTNDEPPALEGTRPEFNIVYVPDDDDEDMIEWSYDYDDEDPDDTDGVRPR